MTRLREVVAGLLIAGGVSPGFVLAQAPEAPTSAPADGKLQGRIAESDGKAPVAGAVVRLCFLDSGTTLSSTASDARGDYEITGLPNGYADLVVETSEGVFVASQILLFPPAGRMHVSLVLVKYTERPATSKGGPDRRPETPCSSHSPVGSAQVRQKQWGKGFLGSAEGIAIIAGASAAVLLVIAAGGGEEPASAF